MLLEPGGILAVGLAPRLLRVAPGPAEHPVVQPLAALAEALAWAVVRTRDVAVDGDRATGNNLCHQTSLPSPRIRKTGLVAPSGFHSMSSTHMPQDTSLRAGTWVIDALHS